MKRSALSGMCLLVLLTSTVDAADRKPAVNLWPFKSAQDDAPTIKKRKTKPSTSHADGTGSSLSPAGLLSTLNRGTEALVAGSKSTWHGIQRFSQRLVAPMRKPMKPAKKTEASGGLTSFFRTKQDQDRALETASDGKSLLRR